jgi:hypothetical protein
MNTLYYLIFESPPTLKSSLHIYIAQEQGNLVVLKVNARVILRPTVSLSWCQATIWSPRPIFLFCGIEIIFRQFRVSCYEAPSDEGMGL